MWPPFAPKITLVLQSLFVQRFSSTAQVVATFLENLPHAFCGFIPSALHLSLRITLNWVHDIEVRALTILFVTENTSLWLKLYVSSCCHAAEWIWNRSKTWPDILWWIRTFEVPETFAKYCRCINRHRKQLWSVSAVKETIAREHICRFLSVLFSVGVHVFLSTNQHRSSTMKLAY